MPGLAAPPIALSAQDKNLAPARRLRQYLPGYLVWSQSGSGGSYPISRPKRASADGRSLEKSSWDAGPGRPAVRPLRLRAARTGLFVVAGGAASPLMTTDIPLGWNGKAGDRRYDRS